MNEISATCSKAIISKTQSIFSNFHCIFAIWTKFCVFQVKKRPALQLKYLGSYWLREVLLLECQRASVLEHPSKLNVFKGNKHCCNDHSSTFVMSSVWSKTHWVGKPLCLSDLCLVTRWLPITWILVVRWRKFRERVQTWLSQKRKTIFGIFILFSESTQNLVHFVKKDQVYSLNILEVIDSEKCCWLNARKLMF